MTQFEEMTPAAANGQDKFGTYLRDAATGLDYANQRYYSPGFGRFLTGDPSGYADPADPGSWNQYVYVQGDPANLVDPGGKTPYPAGLYYDIWALIHSTNLAFAFMPFGIFHFRPHLRRLYPVRCSRLQWLTILRGLWSGLPIRARR